MLMDDLMPFYHFSERHSTEIKAAPAKVYQALFSANLFESPIAQTLIRLQGLGRKPQSSITLRDLISQGFIVLTELPTQEIVLGLLERIWGPKRPKTHINTQAFQEFDMPGYARITWSFCVQGLPEGKTLLSTETRVHCLSPRSRRKFTLYWLLIRPFSGLIRRMFLTAIRRQVYRAATHG